MESRTRLTHEDVAALLESVYVYNGYTNVRTIGFYDEQGQPIQFIAEVVCDVPGLKVRVAPDEDASSPEDMTRKAILQMRKAQGRA